MWEFSSFRLTATEMEVGHLPWSIVNVFLDLELALEEKVIDFKGCQIFPNTFHTYQELVYNVLIYFYINESMLNN
jgi:hypothetical protein